MISRARTTEEQLLHQTPGQFTRYWIAFYKPNTIYTARLASLPSSNDMVYEISFTSGSGTLADVKKEMTLWVGTTLGARDLGMCRIRKDPISGTFYIGVTSDVIWQASCFLTVVDAPRIEARNARVSAGDLKLDEISFSDQYTDFDPVPIMGDDAIEWLTGTSIDVFFDGTDSWVFGSTITDYAWSAPRASASSGMTTATPTITYDATGIYTVYCTVTAANGKSYTGIRQVFIFGPGFMPSKAILTSDPSGSLDDGGWAYSIKMYANADPTNVIEGCLAILFGKDWYGSTQQSIGQVEHRENIICSGYVAAETIDWDSEASEVEFTVEGAHIWMDGMEFEATKLTMATNTPTSWNEMPSMTVDRALWYLLHWRSNVTALMDVYLTDDPRYLPVAETDGTLWEQVKSIAWSKIFALPFVDRFGRLLVKIHPQLTPEADRTWATIMPITKKDWKDQIRTKRNAHRKQISMLSMSGWIADPSGNVNTVYGLSMGHIQARYGKPEIIDKLLAVSQAQINTMTGLYIEWKNRELDFEISLGQNNRMIDLFPPQYLEISLLAGDTPRGIEYDGKLIPTSVTLEYDPEAYCFETVLGCEPEIFAGMAINGDVPPSSGIEDWDQSSFPDFEMPNMAGIGEIVSLPSSVENANHPKVVVIAGSLGVFYTENFDADSPQWKAMSVGIDPSILAGSTKFLRVTPNGTLWIVIRAAIDYVYRASKIGSAWTLMGDSVSLGGYSVLSLGVDPTYSERVAVLSGVTADFMGPVVLYTSVNGSALSAGASSMSIRPASQCSTVRYGGKWFIFFSGGGGFGTAGGGVLNDGGTLGTAADITSAAGQDAAPRFALALPSKIFQWDSSGAGGYNMIAPSTLIPTRYTGINLAHNDQAAAFSPSGNYAMACDALGTPYVSTDGGASWSSVAGVLSIGSDIFENCKDDNRFIFGGGTILRLTLDRGVSYVEKSGNLGYIAPLIDIECIRFIS